MTNFNQIIDEIQQQKLAVASQIDELNQLITTKQQEISDLQADIPELEAQLAGLVTLEEKTIELQQTAAGANINLNINVTSDGNTAYSGSTTVNQG